MNTAVPLSAPRRLVVRARRWAVVAAASALMVSACTGPPAPVGTRGESGGDSPSTEAGTTPSADALQSGSAEGPVDEGQSQEGPEQSPPDDPVADEARVVEAVDSALLDLVAAQTSVTREQVRTAIEQGFTSAEVLPDSIEVSIDSTPTGLDVDAIQGAGRTGDTCVFGEIREGEVSVAVLPVLSSGHCFVGDQR